MIWGPGSTGENDFSVEVILVWKNIPDKGSQRVGGESLSGDGRREAGERK